MIDDRLSVSVKHADGTTTRWAPDEPDAANVLDDITLGTSTPGGFRDMGGSLVRDLRRANTDQRIFDEIHVYGAGRRTAWEGRTTQFPYADGRMAPAAVGHGAHLKDDNSLVEVFVDRDLSHWQAPPLNRQAALLGGGVVVGAKFDWASAIGGTACVLPNEVISAQNDAELWYTMPAGLKASRVAYKGQANGTLSGYAEGFVATDSDAGSPSDSYAWTLDNTVRAAALTTPRRYVNATVYSNGTALTPAAGTNRRFTQLAVYGTHGLTRQAISGEPDGFYVPDMVRNVVERWAPNLTIGEFDADTFVCPHMVFGAPTNAEDAVSRLNAFLLWDWLVYDGKTFSYTAPDPARLTWQARRSEGARLNLTGDDAEQQFNGVVVTYQDAAGQKRITGPPATYWEGGVAKADTTNSLLVDTSETNPVNAAGIPRRWGLLELTFATTDLAAQQIGAVWLAEHAQPQRRGEITLQGVGSVVHPTQGLLPTWCVRAGQFIKVGDIRNDTPRRIISTTYAHATRTLTAQLDNTAQKLDALFERIGVGLVGFI